ncbi:MAG: NAD(P)-dependent oxidoreductase, partial [Pseudomonadota bacterium]
MTTLPPVVLYAGHPDQRAEYAEHLSTAFAAERLDVRLIMDPAEIGPPEVTHLVFAGHGPLTDLTPYTGLRAILNLWAGVETILPRPDLPKDVPLCRMVEPGLTLGMVDYVTGHVLRYHLAIDRYIGAAPITEWERNFPPLAADRMVGILGLGTLGQACAGALKGLGFRVSGWSRSQKSLPGLRCHHGPQGLDTLLSEAEILVGLLPQTPETTGLLNAETLARLPQGACLINAGRGALIDDAALLKALDNAHLGHA